MSTKCEMCHLNEHKYKCPKCELKTCSLVCCKNHKTDTNCDGKREKTKFLKMDEFTERELLNDYRFLEEQSRIVDASHRDPIVHDSGTFSSQSTGFYENLKKFVYNEFGICLRLMPVQSTRHQANKTRFNRAIKMVSWSLELIFHLDSLSDSKSSNLLKFNTRTTLFSSNETLRNGLIKFYQKYKTDLFEQSDRSAKSTSPVSLYTSFNAIFQEEKLENLNILFQVNDFSQKRKFFVKFDLDKNLGEILEKRTIIEYPTFYVVKKENLGEYDLVDEGDLKKQVQNDQETIPQKSNDNKIEKSDKLENMEREDGEVEDESDEDEEMHYLNPLLDPSRKNENSTTQNKKIKLDKKDDEIEDGEATSDSE